MHGLTHFTLLIFSLQTAIVIASAITGGSGCPLEFNHFNFTEAVSACSEQDRGRCCRYLNALVGISIAQYANRTGQLGVPSESSETCISSISDAFKVSGLSSNATALCGLGTRIPVNFQCANLTTIQEMEQTSKFKEVSLNCMNSVSSLSTCRKCLNATTVFLHRLVGAEDHMALSTCRDATFVAIASYGDSEFTIDRASCFFGLSGLHVIPDASSFSKPPSEAFFPKISSTPVFSPAYAPLGVSSLGKSHSTYHLTLIPRVGLGITGVACTLLIFLILLICRKRKELENSGKPTIFMLNKISSSQPRWKLHKWRRGPSAMFRRFSNKEIQKATNDFFTIIGKGGFGTVYKAQFENGFVAAVKRMNKISEQGEEEFCKEMELLGRLHHRHLVTLKGFCAEQQERFLVYEYMENGSLKNHLHDSSKPSLSWQTRIQIAVDVATALEYLHFYCDPPLCHRDIKSSNILLDENFVAKVADFGLAHAAPSGANNFEPINTDVRGTPGYMDPEYVITQELTEKSDIYSYGVLLLELITARRAVHERKNLVEWAQTYIATCSRLPEIVDPNLADNYNFEELQSLVSVVKLCTQREGKARPSIKQVLRLLYDKLDTASCNLMIAARSEDFTNKGNTQRVRSANGIDLSGDLRCLQSSPSTSRSYCSRSFLLESGSPRSPISAPVSA
ncbi:hypothetical protein SUGI_0453840 [Cryptomeria japonica]|uniref:probable receptor-like protein kinase At1g49730 isoform X2 n=1 Tax=Cryptomeria japonica TaxID=3369 RepID=UPI0024089E21|nr:probable receptor-like protein kinase At1g49730 isoform X2 [Cryptomeria japonica]GLJ23885.1 hypothetical protein SUGI_0453840 [Cryptomeria japonica]